MCSPNYHTHKLHDIPRPHISPNPIHFHEFDSHLCDAFHNVCPLENMHKPKSPQPRFSTNYLQSPPKPANDPTEPKHGFRNCHLKSPHCDEKVSTARKKMHRAKSCPKDLFSGSSKCSENEDVENEHECEHEHRFHHQLAPPHRRKHDHDHHNYGNDSEKSQNGSAGSNWLRQPSPEEYTPCYTDEFASPTISRQQNSRQQMARMKTIPKIKIHKPQSKTPNSMDEFISSKLVKRYGTVNVINTMLLVFTSHSMFVL